MDDPFYAGRRGERPDPRWSAGEHADWMQGRAGGGHNQPIYTDATTGEMLGGIMFALGVVAAVYFFLVYGPEFFSRGDPAGRGGISGQTAASTKFAVSVIGVCVVGVLIAVAGSLVTTLAMAKGRIGQVRKRVLRRTAIAAAAAVLWVIALLAYVTMSGRFETIAARAFVAAAGSAAIVALVHVVALRGALPFGQRLLAAFLNALFFIVILGFLAGPRVWSQLT